MIHGTLSAWLLSAGELFRSEPLVGGVVVVVIVLLLYWQFKLMLKLVLAILVLWIGFLLLGNLGALTSSGIDQKSKMTHETTH